MSIQNWPGGVINKTPPTPSGPYEDSMASGVWTLQQAADYVKQGNWPTAGNTNPDVFIENLFQTWLYTGNGSTQTITNGVDLAGKGGLVWIKSRGLANDHYLFDTNRGANKRIESNTTDPEVTATTTLSAFNANGFSLDGGASATNTNGQTYASWTFREQPKFFDVVTYTGTGSARTVPHNLGSEPGFIIVKRTNSADEWFCYHRSLSANNVIYLNLTNATNSAPNMWNNTAPTSTVFSLGTDTGVNANGGTYVAYLFAHNAGGFGLTGTDNVISCGSFTGSSGSINLGYEPQWLLVKQSNGTNGWRIFDNMRGWTVGPTKTTGNAILFANTPDAEIDGPGYWGTPTATGFDFDTGGGNYIYVAIRRGPMKTPTTGTSVFSPQVQTPTGSAGYVMAGSSGFPVDWLITKQQTQNNGPFTTSRLTNNFLRTSSTAAEGAATYGFDLMQGVSAAWDAQSTVSYAFRRTPSAFDVVCYTGVNPGGATLTVNHNLGVTPELVIIKNRVGVADWFTYSAPTGTSNTLYLNLTNAATAYTLVTSPTASTFVANGVANVDTNTFVAYLFATCPGVSKVGSFTGTGATQVINCGFTTGARFVLIKATSTTGSWYVWDSARGIVAGNDPYLLLNSTAAEVTNTDWVDTAATGFELSNAGGNLANSNGVSYIFLAIA
jgi:hypothetical protein